MKTHRSFFSWLLSATIALALISCVGGDPTGEDPNTPPVNLPDNPDTPTNTYSASGSVQKGPFTQGTNITIQPLDDNFNPTGKQYQTKTTDDTGTFSVGSEIENRYVEIIATGYYYNEIEGKVSSSTLTLRSISDLTETGKTNVNLLTTLESDRIRKLLEEGGSLVDARKQAEREILEVFHISTEQSVAFDKMDITGSKDADAILLAISASLQAGRSVGELSELISKIAGDIANSGELTTPNLATQITESSKLVDADKVRENLRKRYTQLGVQNFKIPPFEDYHDVNGNGVIDKEDAWIILGSKEGTIGAQGGTFTINLQHSKPFDVIIEDAAWVRQTENTRAYLEEATLHFTVDASTEADERKAIIRIKDKDSNYSELFHLTQRQKDYLDPEEADYTLPFESGTLEIPVSVNVNYTVGIKQTGEWLHYVETRALRNETLVFNYDYNGSPSPRSATITLTAEGKTTEISVAQRANEGEITLYVKTPGTLSTLMSMEDMYQIINLKIVGTLNDDDLKLLNGGKYVGGSNVIGGGEAHFECDWKVETLDLSEMKSESDIIGASGGDLSFFNCVPSLKKVVMPKQITTIGYNAFNKCINLKTIEWGEDSEVEDIQGSIEASSLPGAPTKYYGAFKECVSLEEVTLPKSIKHFRAGAFMNCTSLKRLVFPNDGDIMELECAVSITSTGISQTAHPMGHLWGCTSLETIVLPDNLRTIGGDAFYQTPFRTIVIPETVKYLTTSGLFYGCNRLEEVTLPSSVTEYSKEMFAGCTSLQSIKGVGKITKYCEGCFAGCPAKWVVLDPEAEYEAGVFAETNVESVAFPAGFKTIPERLFEECEKLSSVDLGEVETIGNYAFNGCPIKTVIIPKSVTFIGSYVFTGYPIPDNQYGEKAPMDNVYIYAEDIQLGTDGYGGTFVATQVTFGKMVRRVSGQIGSGTSSIIFEEGSVCEYFDAALACDIKSIELPNSITELGAEAFTGCKNLKTITLPSSLKKIGDRAFRSCEKLESVIMPDGLEVIEKYAFSSCNSLESVTIPYTVAYLGNNAFGANAYLEEVHMKSIEPPYAKSNLFADCPYLDKIQVPDEAVDAYKASWSTYASIIVGGEADGKHRELSYVKTTTLDATDIGLSVAKLKGQLSLLVEPTYKSAAFCISTDPNDLTINGGEFPSGNWVSAPLAADDSFEKNVGQLTKGTTYYYRSRVLVDNIEFLGEIKSFTTRSDLGAYTFKTEDAVVGDDLSAILVGSLDFESNGLTLNDADTWVVFNVGESADNLNNEYIATKGPVGESQVGDWIEGTFWTRLSNLEEGKTYYYRAKGYLKSKTLGNTEEVIYGEVKSFVAKKVVSVEPTSYSYTFTQAAFSGNGEAVLGGLVWTLAGNGGHWGYDETKGQQFGSKNNPYKTMTLTSGDVNKVTKIVVNTSGASGTTAKLTVTVGGVQLGSVVSLTTTATEYTFTSTEPLSGPAVLFYAHTSDGKAIYIKSITIE